MPIADYQVAAKKIADFLQLLNDLGGLRLKYRIVAGEGARDPEGLEAREIYVQLAGPDTDLLLDRDAELLRALETLAAQILRLDQREHDLVSFDAGGYKAMRAQEFKLRAETAAEQVLRTGAPYAFPPSNSRERRLLHMSFRDIPGVQTESHGEGANRFLVVFPEGKTDLPVTPPAMRPGGFGYGDRGRSDRGRSEDRRGARDGHGDRHPGRPRGFDRR